MLRRVKAKVDMPPRPPCAWARWLLRSPGFVVWDVETTHLGGDAKIVSIGAVDQDGRVLLDVLINPGVPIPQSATAVHGITDEMVKGAPTFEAVYPAIREVLHGQRWVIYNRAFDVPRLDYECDRYGLARIAPHQFSRTREHRAWMWNYETHDSHCAMEAFAELYGDWSDYHESYRWQKLTTAAEFFGISDEGAHDALRDAQMTLKIVQGMALREDREEQS